MTITEKREAAKAEKKAANIQRCSDAAEDNARHINTLLAVIHEAAEKLAEQAEANRDAGKAAWGTVGSLAHLTDQLLDTLDGFEAHMKPEHVGIVEAIREEHEGGW